MKKIIAIVLVLVCVLSLAGCQKAEYKDGTYTAQLSEAKTEAAHGWCDYVTVTVKDGKVTAVEFNSLNAEGKKKSECTAEEYPMDPLPSEWIPQISENLAKTTDATKVDTVSGATYATENAKALYAAALEAARAGKTETVILAD